MNTPSHRILALDVHQASFGFAVLQDGTLLDWGVRRRTQKGERGRVRLIQKQLLFLLRLWQPYCMIIRRARMLPLRKGVIARMRKLASAAHIPVKELKPEDLEREFGRRKITQHDIARIVAERFPVLGWKLPPKRRIIENQPYHLSTFMAVAAGCALPRTRRCYN